MLKRSHLIVLGVVVAILIAAIGISARDIVQQQSAINGLKTQVSSLHGQVTSLRGPTVKGAIPLTLAGVEGDASQAETDAQNALSASGSASTQPTIDPNAGAVATLQTQVSCLENDLQELADYQQQGQNTTLWFSTC